MVRFSRLPNAEGIVEGAAVLSFRWLWRGWIDCQIMADPSPQLSLSADGCLLPKRHASTECARLMRIVCLTNYLQLSYARKRTSSNRLVNTRGDWDLLRCVQHQLPPAALHFYPKGYHLEFLSVSFLRDCFVILLKAVPGIYRGVYLVLPPSLYLWQLFILADTVAIIIVFTSIW